MWVCVLVASYTPMKKVSGAPSPANSSTVPGSNLSQSPTANTNRPESWKIVPQILILKLTIVTAHENAAPDFKIELTGKSVWPLSSLEQSCLLPFFVFFPID